jgi:hypothetical protein
VRKTVVLYGYETRYLALREEHRMRVFEKGVLRRTGGHKSEQVAGNMEKSL